MKREISFLTAILFLLSANLFPTSVRAADERVVYVSENFDESIGIAVSSYDGIITRETVSGEGVLHFLEPMGTSNSAYADVICPSLEAADNYVVELRLKVNALSGSGAYIGLFDAKTAVHPKWRIGSRITTDGTIYLSQKPVGRWKTGEWIRYSAVYNVKNGRCDIYMNGVLTWSSIYVGTLRPSTLRIDVVNKSGAGDVDVYIDDLRIYSGTSPAAEDSVMNNPDSIMDNYDAARNALADKEAYAVYSNYYYQNNTRKSYPTVAHRPIVSDGTVYVSSAFVSDILEYSIEKNGSTVTLSGVGSFSAVQKNNEVYLSLSEIASKLGKQFYYDERGIAVLSSEKYEYGDSEHFIDMYDMADLIYRYLQFEHPSGEQMMSDIKRNVEGQHPRILYTSEDLAYIEEKGKTDLNWNSALARVTAEANISMGLSASFTADCADSDKQMQARNFQEAVRKLAEGYLLTGNEVYADEAITYIKTLCQWTSLGLSSSNLTTGHWAMGMAIGYDSFYNYMIETTYGQETLELMREASSRLAFADSIRAYRGEGGAHWPVIRDNFSGVVGGGVMALALAMADETKFFEEISYLLENVIKSNEIAVSLFYPDGGYYEGVGYAEYMLRNLVLSTEALFHCCGTDYGLGSVRGFSKAGSLFVYLQTPEESFNFHDSTPGALTVGFPYWFGLRYGEYETAQQAWEQNRLRRAPMDALGLLYYSKMIDQSGAVDTAEQPLDKYFSGIDTGSFRNNFDVVHPTFVGFHGGWTHLYHDMLDLGSFIFEADGVSWAKDLGKDDYSIPNYFADVGYQIYRKRPEGENCVVINPTADGNDYYGQKLDAYAGLYRKETSETEALAILDLSEAYERDVTSYHRGYFFGDNRNTLTVQDEMSLRSSSEVYWFMHTPANIEIIDKNTAILTENGKILRVEVYSNASNFELLDMAPSPLPSSPTIPGQSSNAGIRKLAVHVEETSGDLAISVKLIPVREDYTAAPLTFLELESWTTSSEEAKAELMLLDVSVNGEGVLGATVQLPHGTSEAKLFVDGAEKYNLPLVCGRPYAMDKIDVSTLGVGIHTAKLESIDAAGNRESTAARFVVKKYSRKVLYENELTGFDGIREDTDDNWFFQKKGTLKYSTDGATLVSDGSSAIWMDFRTETPGKEHTDGIFAVSCEVKLSSVSGTLEFECKSEQVNDWFLNDTLLISNGQILGGGQYIPGEWIPIMLLVDLDSGLCSVKIDGKWVMFNEPNTAAYAIALSKLQYTTAEKGAEFSCRNYRAEKLTPLAERASLTVICDSYTAQVYARIPQMAECAQENITMFLAAYSGKELKSIQFKKIKGAEISSVDWQEDFPVPKGTQSVKAMLWNDELMPLCNFTCVQLIR